jgi:nitric oxide reductase subunit B
MRSAYRFFLHTLLLLTLYGIANLIMGLKFLPGDVTQNSLPFNQISALTAALLDLAILGGLLGGGIYISLPPGTGITQPDDPALHRIAVRLWSLLVILTLAAGILNLMFLLPLLAILKVIVIALVVVGARRAVPLHRSSIPLVWAVGMILSGACTLILLFPTPDFQLDAALQALAGGLNVYIAYVLAAAALAFWLMHRFSNITPLLAETSLNTVAGLLALAGALMTLSTLDTLGVSLSWVSSASAILVPLLYLIFAAHTYRAFSDRNPTNTLAGHWTALGVLLLVLGVGLLGGLQAAVRQWTAGTRLSDLQPTLALWAVAAILLGMINQVSAEMRGHNQRVTGLAPFWLVAFGAVGSGLALAGAGLVQVYLERVLSIGFLDTQALIVPLYQLWLLGLVTLALGIAVYTVIVWLRRPR